MVPLAATRREARCERDPIRSSRPTSPRREARASSDAAVQAHCEERQARSSASEMEPAIGIAGDLDVESSRRPHQLGPTRDLAAYLHSEDAVHGTRIGRPGRWRTAFEPDRPDVARDRCDSGRALAAASPSSRSAGTGAEALVTRSGARRAWSSPAGRRWRSDQPRSRCRAPAPSRRAAFRPCTSEAATEIRCGRASTRGCAATARSTRGRSASAGWRRSRRSPCSPRSCSRPHRQRAVARRLSAT